MTGSVESDENRPRLVEMVGRDDAAGARFVPVERLEELDA
jgi:hypothetical protein